MLLPNIAEQKEILNNLGVELEPVNTAIARTEREIALMQEYRKRQTADIVTGKLDVREAATKLPDLPADTDHLPDAKKALTDYWTKVPATKSELEAWHAEAKAADWVTPTDVKAKYGNASILRDGRVVFNICGNKHRLVVWINYDYRTIYVRFLGTHEKYDEINAQDV